jgi:uncharacterized RDD family membrane protein YckC
MEPSSPSQQRYAPPSAEVADVPAGTEAELAGRGARFLAAVVDTVLLLLIWGVMAWVTPWNVFSASVATTSAMAQVGLSLLGIALFLAVNGALLARSGQTIGKRAFGLRITRNDRSAASFRRLAGLRYGLGGLLSSLPIVGVVYALVDVLFIFRADRRCLHDLIADTIVVKV